MFHVCTERDYAECPSRQQTYNNVLVFVFFIDHNFVFVHLFDLLSTTVNLLDQMCSACLLRQTFVNQLR